MIADEDEESVARKNGDKATKLGKFNFMSHKSFAHYKVQEIKDEQEEVVLYGKALYLFGPNNGFRKVCSKIVRHTIFENFIILLILISTINLALESPLEDPQS